MSYTTISSFQLQGDWPSNYGTSGTLGIFCTSDFVADDGKAFQGGDGSSLTSQFVTKAAITVSANVATVASFSLPKTDQASPNTIRYFGVIFKVTGSPTDDYIFTNFHLRASLGNSINYLAWWNDNQQITRPQDDSHPTTNQMNTAINAAINNPASTTQNGLVEVDTTPVDTAHPVVVGSNSYRITTQGKDIRDFGVVGDGITDDTSKFQDAINSSPLRRLFIPRSLTIKHTGLKIYGKIGLIIEGEKGGSYQDTASRFNYVGANSGKAFDIVNSGSILLKDLTISTGGYDTGAATYADIGVNIDKSADTGTYGVGSTSEITIENCHLRGGVTNANTPNSAFMGIQVNPSATSNCELMRFRRCSFFLAGANYSDPTNTSRGRGIVFVNAGNNSVNNVVEDCYVLGAYLPYEARAGAQVRFINNEANYATIVYRIVGAGNCYISSDRTETHRQFLVGVGTVLTMESCLIPNGGWNASYPVIEIQGGGELRSIGTSFSAQAGIQAYANTTTPTARLIVIGGGVPDIALSGFGTFTQKATVIGGTYMAGDSSQSGVITNTPLRWMTSVGAADTAESLIEVDGSGFLRINTAGDRQVRLHNDSLIVTSTANLLANDLQHTGSKVGFNNTTPISKPTVTGSRAANAALTSLLTQLAALGLITDSSS